MLTFFHSPQTRSTGVRVLLEELSVPYTLHAMNMKAGEHRRPEFMAVNPLGKVPAIVHDGALVTEQGAIYLYLADTFADAGLAPPVGDALRGPFLRWLFMYGSAFEPAVVDKALERDPGRPGMSPYGSFDAVIDAVATQLEPGPFLLGDRFTAADILWGGAINWMLMFKLVPERPVFSGYAQRITSRPAYAAVSAADAVLAKEYEAAAPPA